MDMFHKMVFLTDDSIANNIALGREDGEINMKRIKDLISICNLEKLISELPDGVMNEVGERGARLSGGQKQRIGIARALYKDPPIIIFDEATSAIDINNEKEIFSKIFDKKNKTAVIVTHRPETLKYCNKVYKVENGKLFEQ